MEGFMGNADGIGHPVMVVFHDRLYYWFPFGRPLHSHQFIAGGIGDIIIEPLRLREYIINEGTVFTNISGRGVQGLHQYQFEILPEGLDDRFLIHFFNDVIHL